MWKRILQHKGLITTAMIAALLAASSADALAKSNHSRPGHGPSHGGKPQYYYRWGRWHDSGAFWGLFGATLAAGAIVASLPPRHETVYVREVPYYRCDGIYYRPCSRGYVVVPEPAPVTVVTPAPMTVVPAPSAETVVVNIPNSGGGYTAVTLTRHRTGYLGPQGEYYEGHPTVEQLRALYGR
ncbi:MAG TPA: hypothetical protein PLJ26_00480 [Candidatus Omnitrophota bacterium]|nr:hypothetical protein [Candidatus Omnitrophota bacterium]